MNVHEVRVLPHKAHQVAKLIGAEKTLRLLMACTDGKKRGQYIHVPKKIWAKPCKLEVLIGRESLLKLIEVYGGDRLYLSSKREWMINYRIGCILELKALGCTVPDIAAFFGVSDKYVYRLTGDGRQDS